MGYAKRGGIAAAVLSTIFFFPAAHAGLIGTAGVSDITLDGSAADVFQYASGVNPQQGRSGNTSGFSSAFNSYGSGNWNMLSKFTSSAGNASAATAGGVQMVFNKTDTRHGAWSITNTSASQDVTLDLVFAMHAGNGSGAWLFDNQFIGAGATVSGVWNLNVYNDGRQYADYSNLTFFSRNAVLTAPKPAVTQPAAPATAPVTAPVTAPTGSAGNANSTASASTTAASGPASAGAAATTAAAVVTTAATLEPDLSNFAAPSEAAAAFTGTLAAAVAPEILGIGSGQAAASVPEPASLAILASGLALMAMVLRRRARATWRVPGFYQAP